MDIFLLTVASCLIALVLPSVSAARLSNIEKWIGVAVKSAEMLHIANGQGLLKKEVVFAFIMKKFKSLKADDINLLIESAVFELNKK